MRMAIAIAAALGLAALIPPSPSSAGETAAPPREATGALDARRDALLSDAVLDEMRTGDPLLADWLSVQRTITRNLAAAIAADPDRADSLRADYDYLLRRYDEEIAYARAHPVPDPSLRHHVMDFGAKADGATDDNAAIHQAIAAAAEGRDGKRTVFLPRGRYRVGNVGPVTGNIKLENLERIRLVGEEGTEILLPGPLDVGLRIAGCNDVGVENLTFVYEKPPITTGVVIGLPAPDRIRVRIDAGMADPTDPMFIRAQTKGLMRFHTPERIGETLRPRLSSVAPHQGGPKVARVEEAGDNVFDFTVATYTPTEKHYAAGMRVAFYARTYGNHTVNNHRSNRTRLENLVINTSSAMAILNNGSDRPFISGCRIEAAPGTFVSTSADGLYFRNVHLGGLVKDTVVRHVGDDFLNVHALAFPAEAAEGRTVWLKASEWNADRLVPGARFGFLRLAAGRDNVDREFRIVSVERKDDRLGVTFDAEPEKLLTRADGAPLPDLVLSLDAQSHGLAVIGNRFEDGLSRILYGGRNGLFADNTIRDSLHHSFFMNLCPEPKGKNGGELVVPRNLEISGNHMETAAKTLFRFGGRANPAVAADAAFPSASHIRIVDNVIVVDGSSSRPLVSVDGVDFLTLSGNRVTASKPQDASWLKVEGGKRLARENNTVVGAWK